MRIPRVFIENPLMVHSEVTLSPHASNYLVKVLRMEVGRPLIAFNGDGFEYPSMLMSTSKNSAIIKIEQQEQIDRESSLNTHLAIAISRGDRMDWVLQKATELGVTEITPLFTERTEVKLKSERLQKKLDHWQQIIISTCEQCQRNRLPKLNPALSLNDFFALPLQGLKLVLHHRSEQALKQHKPTKAVTLLIGPEGGLSEDEIKQAVSQQGFSPLTLGPRVLRTETAPIVALTAIQLEWGDMS